VSHTCEATFGVPGRGRIEEAHASREKRESPLTRADCPMRSSALAGVAAGWLLAQEPLPGCDELAGFGWSP
jgi:hypothetical protein